MASPVDRNLNAPSLGGFNAFVYDSGRATAADARARASRGVTGLGIVANDYAAQLKREQEQATAIAEQTQATKDIIELEERANPLISEIAQDDALDPAAKIQAFDERWELLTEGYSYTTPTVAANATKARLTLNQQFKQALSNAITKDQQAKAQANIFTSLQALSRLSVNAPDMAIHRAEALIRNMGAKAGWDDAKVEEEVAKWSGTMEANHIRRMMSDPAQVQDIQTRLLDESQYPNLDPASRTRLLEQAARMVEQHDRERIRLLEKEERDAERAREAAQEAQAAQFRVGVMSGDVGEVDLTAALEQRRITLQDFDSLLSALRKEDAGIDDPDTVVDLTRSIPAGLVSDARIFQSYADGRLSADTAQALLAKNEAARASGGVLARREVRTAQSYVETMVGGRKTLLGTFTDPAAAERVASALDEFDQAIQEEYDIARAEGRPPDVRAVRDRVVKLWKPDTTLVRSAMRRPEAASRPMTLQELEQAKQATMQAFEAGQFDEVALVREVELLQDYERLILEEEALRAQRER